MAHPLADRPSRRARRAPLGAVLAATLCGGVAFAVIVPLTFEDFRLPGTQLGGVNPGALRSSSECAVCHSNFAPGDPEPYEAWQGSLMALAGKDPLFYAQMTLANQDVSNAGTFCLRCHVPVAQATGHAMPPDGSALTAEDREGVSCNFCHSMVDPVYVPGQSPTADEAILAALPGGAPQHYGNAMFVLDREGGRRGPRPTSSVMHEFTKSDFFTRGEYCGTCHEVGNVAVSRQPDGTYRYNAIGQPAPDTNPDTMFPLERTYSEWKLSAYANGGVDMGGRFGGTGVTTVSTCQDCHMPRVSAKTCIAGPVHADARKHEFAGAGAQVLDIIALWTESDPTVSQSAIQRSRAASVSMLQRAATLELTQSGPFVNVRTINESGHKLPTGHIEGRRVWVSVEFLDSGGAVIAERGRYDHATAELDTASTTVYEMRVGLSASASGVTGLPAGPTGHMALADTIEKDNRIPPRGFSNAAFEGKGAPVVGADYADGQHWADRPYSIPAGATAARVRLYYQNTPKFYIEELRDNNHTDHWGDTLHALWEESGRGAPIEMATATITLGTFCRADFNADGSRSVQDIYDYLESWIGIDDRADINGAGGVSVQDLYDFLAEWFSGCD